MKCVLWLALVAAVTLSVLPERTEAKQYDDSHPVGDDDHNDKDGNVSEEKIDGNGVDETEKENEGVKKDDKADNAGEESENVRKVTENQRENGVGNHRNDGEDDKDNEDNTKAADEEHQSEDSKPDEPMGDEDDVNEQQMSLFDRLLGGKDYIDDNFLAEEYYGEDDLYDNVQEEPHENVFDKEKNEPKNEEDFENEDEDYYDNEEEVVEEEWTGTNLRSNNQNDLEEEEENDSELKDGNLGTVSGREELYFGTSNSVVIGVIVGAVFLAGLLIGLAIMIVTYRLLAKSRGFVRLSKHDEFSSQTPICKKASSPKCDIVSV